MVGRESIEAQEQITSDVIKEIIKKKGDTFQLKLSKRGGKEGMGTEMKVGGNKNEYHPLPIEIFIEIKKNIVKSRRKMESLCHILRCNKVTMTKCIREKLKCNDNKLDDCYEMVKVKTQMNITEEVQIHPTVKRRGRKTAKLTEKVKKTVEEETDLTILKDVSEFLNYLV